MSFLNIVYSRYNLHTCWLNWEILRKGQYKVTWNISRNSNYCLNEWAYGLNENNSAGKLPWGKEVWVYSGI